MPSVVDHDPPMGHAITQGWADFAETILPAIGGDVRTELQSALRRAGLRKVRFHDLRHSVASNLLGAGTDIVTVSKALGHANVHITLTTYAYAIPRERQGAGDALARLMGQSGNKVETWTPKNGIRVSKNVLQVVDLEENGEVAERLNAPVLKTGRASRSS